MIHMLALVCLIVAGVLFILATIPSTSSPRLVSAGLAFIAAAGLFLSGFPA